MGRSLVPYTGVEYLFGGLPPSVRTAPMYAKLPWFANSRFGNAVFMEQGPYAAPLIGAAAALTGASLAESATDNMGTIAGVGLGAGLLTGGGLAAAKMIGKKWTPIVKGQADAYHKAVNPILENIGHSFSADRKISVDDVNKILSHAEAAQAAGLRNFHFSMPQQVDLGYWRNPTTIGDIFPVRGRDPRETNRKIEIYKAFMNPLASTADLTITPRAFSSITKF